jgi:hypothetical protein
MRGVFNVQNVKQKFWNRPFTAHGTLPQTLPIQRS